MDCIRVKIRGEITLNAELLDKVKAESGITETKDLLDWALTMLRQSAKAAKTGRITAFLDETSGKYQEFQAPFLEELKRGSKG
jgi:hypothetical protein